MSMMLQTESQTRFENRISSDDSESSSNIEPCVLPGYDAQPDENGVHHSEHKLRGAARDLQSFAPGAISMQPCQTETETWAYRCTCSFQLVEDANGSICYAMRHRNEPILLQATSFPIANYRIQQAMKELLELLNDGDGVLRRNLTSVSFASSWYESPFSDCFITLNYGKPLQEEVAWKLQALELCNRARLTQITGRSRKVVVTVKGDNRFRTGGHIRDMLWLARRKNDGAIVGVSFDNNVGENEVSVPVQYLKPDTAFFHPNPQVMLQALQWMMTRVSVIASKKMQPRLLEMYCGCGAHTVALARAGLLQLIVAVEWDARLVDSCEANCRSNGCYQPSSHWESVAWNQTAGITTDSGSARRNDNYTTPVFVFKGDASEWARKSLHAQHRRRKSSVLSSHKTWYDYSYDILLVDPPRAGLGDAVCDMAIDGPFDTVLYISCGRDALKRDLQRLSGHFEVVDCLLLDLFPRTDAVESLVHLRRIR